MMLLMGRAFRAPKSGVGKRSLEHGQELERGGHCLAFADRGVLLSLMSHLLPSYALYDGPDEVLISGDG